jgi:hypothetical protein
MTDGVSCYHGSAGCPHGCLCPCDPCYLLRTDAYTGDAIDLRLEEFTDRPGVPVGGSEDA